MKQNLKNQVLILLLLIAMMVSVFLCVALLVVNIHWIVKIFVTIASILLTVYIFITIKKLNKKLVYVEKETVTEETVVKEPSKHKLLCPKCYHPYDGEVCFVCGFNRNENKN